MGLINPTTRTVRGFQAFQQWAKTLTVSQKRMCRLIWQLSVTRVWSHVHLPAPLRGQGFSEVLLDFRQIRSIGPAFADEIFRVFANAHPNTKLIYINANEEVTMMIRRAQATREEGQGLSSSP